MRKISDISFYEFFTFIFVINILLSIVGWRESKKAYKLEQKVRAEIARERDKLKNTYESRYTRIFI